MKLYYRLALLFSLILFLVVFLTADKNDCDACKFNLDNKEYNSNEFMSEYFQSCIDPHLKKDSNILKGGFNSDG